MRISLQGPQQPEETDGAVRQVFSGLQKHFEKGSQETLSKLASWQQLACIWTGRRFCEPAASLLNLGDSLEPALFVAAPWLTERHQSLLLMLGVRPCKCPNIKDTSMLVGKDDRDAGIH